MKKIYFFMALLLSSLTAWKEGVAQTSLSAGDIAIVGYNTSMPSGSVSDEFTFILLKDIQANTAIYFTDFGWCSGSGYTGFQSHNPCGANTGANSDGVIKWTANSALSCGTQVVIQCQFNLAASTGTVTGELAQLTTPGSYMSLATGGDQIFAFTGSLASPNLITGINMDGAWAATLDQCTFSGSPSTLPAALNSTNSIAIVPEINNAVYNGTVTSASPALLRTAIFNVANWNTNDGTAFTLPLPYAFSCVTCVAPDVTADPPNRTLCAGGNTTYSVTATGTGLSYKWQVNTGSGFNDISANATYSNPATATLGVNSVTAGMSGNSYRCIVNGTCGADTSNNGSLTVVVISTSGSQTSVSCFGGSDAMATTVPSGGITPYGYSWSPSGGSNATASGLAAGSYTCTVTDNIGCQATRNVTISQPAAALSAVTSQTNLSCNGGSNGSATVVVSGGTIPYAYSWSPSGGANATASNLSAGSYTCTITDDNNCELSKNFTLTQPSTPLTAATNNTDVACNGGSNGTATVIPSGGTAPYLYSWSPVGGSNATASGLTAGNYTCTITDDSSCQVVKNFTINQPPAVQVAASGDVSICYGANTALLSIASGGTPGYTYNWQPGNLTGAMQNVVPDTTTQYVVTVEDANSCTGSDTVIVTVDPNMAQTSAAGDPVPGNASSTGSQTSGGLESFYNNTCGLIASVQQNAALGTISASVTVLNGIQIFAGRPYVARWYEITPQNNGAGVVTLYFKQSDFDEYNDYATLNNFPLLPQNPSDQDGIDTLVITKISGGTLGTGTASLLTPSSVTWDAAMEYWKVTFSTPSFSQFYVHANNSAGTPLPVLYRSFDVVKEKNTALLHWVTASEKNNKGFSIERSTDGKAYAGIGWVASRAEQGNSAAALDYDFKDRLPASGKNYYRLRQTDIDGNFTYSVVRMLDFAQGAVFTCYPNPAADILYMEHQSEEETVVRIKLIDVTSRLVYEKEVRQLKGLNKNEIRMAGLPQGMYQLVITDKQGVLFRSRVVKK